MLITYLTSHSEIRKIVTVEVMDSELNRRRSLTYEESVNVFKNGFLDSLYMAMCDHIKKIGTHIDGCFYVLGNEIVIDSFSQGIVKNEIALTAGEEWTKGVIHKTTINDLHINNTIILLNSDELHMLSKDGVSDIELYRHVLNSVILFTSTNDVCLELKLNYCKEFSFDVNYFFSYKEARKELKKRCLLELEARHKRALETESKILSRAFEKTNIQI